MIKTPTPLHKKLGIKPDSIILVLNEPNNYLDFFYDFPLNTTIIHNCENKKVGFIHIFVQNRIELEHYFTLAKLNLEKSGFLWVSYPKKSSSLKSELNKFIIMKYGLDNGLVDTKVASINETWSGFKFVYRLKDR